MSLLREYIRNILENLQSHSREPEVGEMVVNVNPNCKHHQSRGEVLDILDLPDNAGKTIVYKVYNNGKTFSSGDILEKTLDQLDLYRV